jgi:hypothetical protein
MVMGIQTLPNDILRRLGRLLSYRSLQSLSTVSKQVSMDIVHTTLRDTCQTGRRQSLLRAIVSVLPSVPETEWEAAAGKKGKRKRKAMDPMSKASWKGAILFRPVSACIAGCGRSTTRKVRGQRICAACSNNPQKRRCFSVSKKTARRLLRQWGCPQTWIRGLPYKLTGVSHLLSFPDLACMAGIPDTSQHRNQALEG